MTPAPAPTNGARLGEMLLVPASLAFFLSLAGAFLASVDRAVPWWHAVAAMPLCVAALLGGGALARRHGRDALAAAAFCLAGAPFYYVCALVLAELAA